MNRFATLKHITSTEYVEYYSVCLDGATDSLFETFIKQHQHETTLAELQILLSWLSKIGDRYRATDRHFRNESESHPTHALPPSFEKELNLRLYCVLLSPHVVVLFSGGIKTAQRAQDCKNVKPHFKLANRLSGLLHQAVNDGQIEWNDQERTDIKIEEDFQLFL